MEINSIIANHFFAKKNENKVKSKRKFCRKYIWSKHIEIWNLYKMMRTKLKEREKRLESQLNGFDIVCQKFNFHQKYNTFVKSKMSFVCFSFSLLFLSRNLAFVLFRSFASFNWALVGNSGRMFFPRARKRH